MLPVEDTMPLVLIFAAAMLLVTFNALTTFELKLNPAAFKLPPVMLPLALIEPALTAAAVIKLPPVTLPVVLIVLLPKLFKNPATSALP